MASFKPRWHRWIARSPPKGQVAGSNPAWGTNFCKTRNHHELKIIDNGYKQAAPDYVMLQ